MSNVKKAHQKKGSMLFMIIITLSFLSFSTMSENMLPQTLGYTAPATWSENANQLRMAKSIEKITKPDATVGIVWSGIVPYFTERKYIDLLGKNDKFIARGKIKLPYEPPRFFEHLRLIWPGHNKWDYEYVLKLQPDIFAQVYPGYEVEKILQNGYIRYIDEFEYFAKKDSSKLNLNN